MDDQQDRSGGPTADHLEHIERLERQNAELDGLARAAAHDLKAPLSAIHGAAVLLRHYDQTLDPERRQVLLDGLIGRAADAIEMVDELLRQARDDGTPTDHVTHLGDVVSWVTDLLDGRIRDTAARVEVAGELPRVPGHAASHRHVFLNLIDNALTYTRVGTPPRVRIGADRHPHGWRVVVEDNGRGIPPTHREVVFQEGRRLDDDTRGSGLGLSTCRALITHVGGRIEVDDSSLGGTAMVLVLPRAD